MRIYRGPHAATVWRMIRRSLPLLLAALLTGCASGQPAMSPAPSAAIPTTTSTPTPTATPAGLNGKAGDTYVGNRVDVTVEQINPKVTTTAAAETWQAAMVKLCAKTDDVTVSTMPWQMIDNNSGRYGNASSYYDDAPKPLYPIGVERVLKGECVRGWILFDAPATVKVAEVRYAAEGESVARWRIA